eukprot:3476754-Pyramimonas_sp.AAC.1
MQNVLASCLLKLHEGKCRSSADTCHTEMIASCASLVLHSLPLWYAGSWLRARSTDWPTYYHLLNHLRSSLPRS